MVKLIALLEGGGNTRFPEKVQNFHKRKKKLPLVPKKVSDIAKFLPQYHSGRQCVQFVSQCLQETFQLRKPSSVCESDNFKLDLPASRCKKCANKEGRDEDPRGLAKRAWKAHKGAVQQLGDVSALIIQNMLNGRYCRIFCRQHQNGLQIHSATVF